MSRRPLFLLAVVPMIALTFVGCNRQNSVQLDYQIGDRVTVGPLVYNVVETVWRSQLGDLFKQHIPERRFLLITLSVTNSGGSEISLPMLTIENQTGQSFRESENGDGVDNWFGVLRNIDPAQTQQGRILFDVPLSSYKLRLPDGVPGSERVAFVAIPLRIDAEVNVDGPTPGPGAGK
jgi:uncharacterized protein DUF4352